MKVSFHLSQDGFRFTLITQDTEKYEIIDLGTTVIVSQHDEESDVFDCSDEPESFEPLEILCHFMRSYPPKTLCSDCVEDILESCRKHIDLYDPQMEEK